MREGGREEKGKREGGEGEGDYLNPSVFSMLTILPSFNCQGI